MILLKKLIFAPLFLLAFVLLISQLNSLLSSYDLIFSFSTNSLIQLIKIAVLLSAASLFFSLSATLAADWKIILSVIILAALFPLLFLNISLAIILTVAIAVSLFLTHLSLQNTLKSYLTFQAATLIGPAIRHLSVLLILSFCLVYFLSTSKLIAEKGFELPDSLIDAALKMTPLPTEQNSTALQLPSIATDLIKDTIKQTVKDQIQGFIRPYHGFIPAILTILLFFTLQSLVALLNLFAYPLLWLFFFIFEKTGFVRFEIEQRPVKKLVV